MFQESVTPPAHVWEKISKVLDQQENIKNSLYNKANVRVISADKVRKKMYYAAFAITAFSCLFFLGK